MTVLNPRSSSNVLPLLSLWVCCTCCLILWMRPKTKEGLNCSTWKTPLHWENNNTALKIHCTEIPPKTRNKLARQCNSLALMKTCISCRNCSYSEHLKHKMHKETKTIQHTYCKIWQCIENEFNKNNSGSKTASRTLNRSSQRLWPIFPIP